MAKKNSHSGTEAGKDAFVISRDFDVPREFMFTLWTDTEHLKHWWGPKGVKVVSCKLDLRPGGIFHYCLKTPDGQNMWGKFVYHEIIKPERIVWTNSFSDEHGEVTRHPWNDGWPLEMHSTLTLAEKAGKTTVTVRWAPQNATDAERKTFEAGFDSMQKGWTGTFDQLNDYWMKSK